MACLRKVLNARSLDYQGPLDRFIGPPVEDWTAALLPEASDKDRDALARDYRNCYDREGWRTAQSSQACARFGSSSTPRGFHFLSARQNTMILRCGF